MIIAVEFTSSSCTSDGCADPFEECDHIARLCECGAGMSRSHTSGKCEWDINRVCLGCISCLTTCTGAYMVCNKGNGLRHLHMTHVQLVKHLS